MVYAYAHGTERLYSFRTAAARKEWLDCVREYQARGQSEERRLGHCEPLTAQQVRTGAYGSAETAIAA